MVARGVSAVPAAAFGLCLALTPALTADEASDSDERQPSAAPIADAASLPSFIFDGFHPRNLGDVLGIHSTATADLVLVRGGFDSGFRNGIMCLVRDGDEDVAEIMLVDVRDNCAAALITSLEDGRVIEPGHLVRIKAVR